MHIDFGRAGGHVRAPVGKDEGHSRRGRVVQPARIARAGHTEGLGPVVPPMLRESHLDVVQLAVGAWHEVNGHVEGMARVDGACAASAGAAARVREASVRPLNGA